MENIEINKNMTFIKYVSKKKLLSSNSNLF